MTTRDSYHHGDLRAALLAEALVMVEQGEPFSIRGVARRVGVSPTAVYRHFANKQALESALAAQGLRSLLQALAADGPPDSPEGVAELAVRYVAFALEHPTLFRLTFGGACDPDSPERVEAAARIHALLERTMAQVFPNGDPTRLASAGWAFAHGMASLHLDGKLTADSPELVADRVRGAFAAAVGVSRCW